MPSKLATLASKPIQLQAADWTGLPQYQLPYFCHSAVLYWLYEAKHGVGPSFASFSALTAPGPAVRGLLAHARRIKRPWVDALLAPDLGSVVVMTKNGVEKHSFIVVAPFRIGGYNQTGWFDESGTKSKGVTSGHSLHLTKNIRWEDDDMVEANHPSNGPCELYAISEADAIGAI